MVKKIVALCDRISVWGGYLSGLLIVLGLGLILLEIVLRNLLDRTLYITEEYSGYLMCALTFCALAYTLKERAHIRMTFLHKVVQGRPRLILDLICCVVGFSFCLYLAFYNSILVWDSVVTGSSPCRFQEPTWPFPNSFLLLALY